MRELGVEFEASAEIKLLNKTTLLMEFYYNLGNRVSASEKVHPNYRRGLLRTGRKVIETIVREDWKGPNCGTVLPITLKEYLDTVSFTTKEVEILNQVYRRMETLVARGEIRKAMQYGNYQINSRLVTKAALHSVLRDVTSPGMYSDLRKCPWFISLDMIRNMCEVFRARKRVWLDKPDGSLRPLAIPSQPDRIREKAIVSFLEITATQFQSSNSIGFRYNQDRHRGLEEFLSKAVRRYGVEGFNIIDTDFRKYYDTIPHSGLRTIVRKLGLKGKGWRYFRSTLNAPVISSSRMMEKSKGKISGPMAERQFVPTMGTPQGGVISPLLANLYGAKLDKGLDSLGYIYLRYADNILVAYPISETKGGIIEVLNKVRPLGITLHPDKTQSLEGNGVLTTLGCGIVREGGQINLRVSEGYLRTPKSGKSEMVSGTFGGIPYVGSILDFLRNLRLHSRHQRSPDRKGWARRVGNRRTYLPKGNPLGLKGGVWRDIKILPQFKGIASLKGTPWYQVRGWVTGRVRVADVRAQAASQRRRVEKLTQRLEGYLSERLAILVGLTPLLPGFSFVDDLLFYKSGRSVYPKYYKKSARYLMELGGRVVLHNMGQQLSMGEAQVLLKGQGSNVFLPNHGRIKSLLGSRGRSGFQRRGPSG